jgi:hypothetical protein
VKLPGHTPGLPGDEISFLLCPLTPALWAGLAGHLPAKIQMSKECQTSKLRSKVIKLPKVPKLNHLTLDTIAHFRHFRHFI